MNNTNLNNLELKEIKEFLTEFDLGANDIQVYLALLRGGKNTLTPLSKQLSLPITTIQSILIRLSEKGIVMSTKNKTRHVYEAYDPSILKVILQRKLEDVGNVLPLLRKLKNTEDDHLHPKVKIFYKDRITDVFHQALECEDKMICEIVSAGNFQEMIGEKFHFTKRRVEKNIRLRSLRVRAHEIKKYSKKTHALELREAKFLPHELDFLGSLMVWDNTVAFFTSKKEGLAIMVESKVIRDTIMQLFELLWSVSGTMETQIEAPGQRV
jgi:sugar-specific transcriptional regulator TrmB